MADVDWFYVRPHLSSSPPGEEIAAGRFSFFRLTVRQIPSREFSRRQRAILLLPGEKAGLREVVTPSRKIGEAENGLLGN
jgi:hypothetical protein